MSNIIKGKIANALTSAAMDHIVATADDIFDENTGKYQSDINKEAISTHDDLIKKIDDVNNKLTSQISSLSEKTQKEIDELDIKYNTKTQKLKDDIELELSNLNTSVNEKINKLKSDTDTELNSILIKLDLLDSYFKNEIANIDQKFTYECDVIKNNIIELDTKIGTKVDKIDGKGLSANDYSNDEKTKLSDLPTKNELDNTLNNKQDKLTPGENISIEDNVISAVDTVYDDTELRDRVEALEEESAKINDVTIPTIVPTTTNFTSGSKWTITTAFERVANLFEGVMGDIKTSIKDLIPSQASTTNQLADKAFVNSSIAKNAANFRGNWETWNNVPSDKSLYPSDYSGNKTPTNNDYLIVTEASGYSAEYNGSWRFLFTGDFDTVGKNGWQPVYRIGSAFTEAQQAAIDSTITSDKVTTYDGYSNRIGANETNKVDKINTGNKIYGTASDGTQTGYELGTNLSFDNGKINANDSELTNRVSVIEGKESGWDAKYDKPNNGIPTSDLEDSQDIENLKKLINTSIENSVFYCGKNDAIEHASEQSRLITGVDTTKGEKKTTGSITVGGKKYDATQGYQITTSSKITITVNSCRKFHLHILSASSSTSARTLVLKKNGNQVGTALTNNSSTIATSSVISNLVSGVYELYTTGGSANICMLVLEIENNSKISLIEETLTNKVDKIDGKGLSTNDYTTDEKNKLNSIESGAQKNVQSDWNATSGDAFIKNKPTIPSDTNDLTNGAGFITSEVTELENFYTKTEINNSLSKKADLVDGLIPASQLPSYVDDVINFLKQVNGANWKTDILNTDVGSLCWNAAAASYLPGGTSDPFYHTFILNKDKTESGLKVVDPEDGKIYICLGDGKCYRWNTLVGANSQLVEISKSLAIGTTSTTAFAGNRGKALEDKLTNYDTVVANAAAVSSKYEKPEGGIPASDLADGVIPDVSGKQDTISDLATIRSGAALGATALQEHQDISGKQDKLTNSLTLTKVGGSTITLTAEQLEQLLALLPEYQSAINTLNEL